MNAFYLILTILIVLAALLLVIAVLLQSSKGEGLASNFTAGNQTFGVRETANGLEKFTWGFMVLIVVLSIVSSFATGTNGADIDVTNKIENADVQTAPQFPTAPVPQEDPTNN